MPSYTLAELSTLLYDSLDNNTGMYPQAQVTDCLNNTVRKLNFLTGMIEDTGTALTQAGRLIYPTPASVIIPTKVYLEGVELEKYSLRQLGESYRNWSTDTTATMGPVARWCPLGISQFVIHPLDAVGGKLLEVNGVQPIVPMVAAGDEVDLDDEFVPVLIDYIRGRLLLKIGGKPFASASTSYQEFIREVKDMVAWQGMIFPAYFIAEALEPAEGKGG